MSKLQPIPPTPVEIVDQQLARLASRKDAWAKTSIAERLALLERVADNLQRHAQEWAETMHEVRGVKKGTTHAGEDWFYGPMVTARNLRLLIAALKAGGQPRPAGLRQRKGGQWVADTFPATMVDRLTFMGWRIEQWIEPGKAPSQGRIYREQTPARVCLVLGAGNVIGIAATDVLHKLFAENELCIVKLNPVNEQGGPPMEKVFQPLIDEGFVAFAYGGADIGKHLTDHAAVETIHITGSDKTHDAILWGRTPEEQQKNKAQKTPRIDKHLSSELGCVTPVIVVPGAWSDDDLERQARSVAGMVQNNMSFMCVAAKVVVLHKEWPLRERFLQRLEAAMASMETRTAYYPGAEQRYAGFKKAYPQAKALSPEASGCVPWTLIRDVPPKKGEYALTNEAFCGVLAETSLSAGSAGEFLDAAVRFVNEDVWGNLSCIVLIDPDTQKAEAAAFDRAIEGLRYGNIGVNAWTGGNFTLMEASFGAFPGNPLDDIQSGRGTVHNGLLFDHPQKAVLYVPFRWLLQYPWSAGYRTFDKLAESLTRFERSGALMKLLPVAAAASRG